MNSLNLRQIDGGNVIKQADFGSNLSFELLDERRRKIPELDGQTATIRLIKGGSIAYQTTKTVADSSVSFKLDKVLEKGVYTLEILVGDYVFPSNHAVKIRVEKTSTDYKPENMVKKDTIYDDTAIKKELSQLNESIAKKKLYYAYANDENGTKGFTKADVYDWFYRELYPYFGISDKDSDNPNDYIWMPARLASNDKLDGAIIEINKLKKLHEARRPPTSYTLDRTTTPWTVWFDNGCGLQMSEYGTTATVYGYGFSASYIDNSIVTFPIIPNIMRVSNGSLTIEKIKTIKGSADYWSPSIKIINPIRDRDDYDWANARFNPEALSTNHYSSDRQQYFIRTMYELGIWSELDVEGFGATKK